MDIGMDWTPQHRPEGSGHGEWDLPFPAVTCPCTSRDISARESQCPWKFFSREMKSCEIQSRQIQGMAGTHLLQVFPLFWATRKQPVRVLLMKEALLAINHMGIPGKGKTPSAAMVSPVSCWSCVANVASRWVHVWHRGKSTEKGRVLTGKEQQPTASLQIHIPLLSSCPLPRWTRCVCLCSLWGPFLFNATKMCCLEREHESFEHAIRDEGGTLCLCPQTLSSHLGVPASPGTGGNKDTLETGKWKQSSLRSAPAQSCWETAV